MPVTRDRECDDGLIEEARARTCRRTYAGSGPTSSELRGRVGLRAAVAGSFLFMNLCLLNDQTLENATVRWRTPP